MNKPLSPWKRILFKRIVPGDIRKLNAESNDARTGGGARDFRFSPANIFWPVFKQMFPAVDSQGRLHATFKWENGTETSTLVFPPTPSRSSECRIASVNECCPIRFLPRGSEESIFLLAEEGDGVHAYFLTSESLAEMAWSKNTKRFFERFLALPIPGNSTPTGYVDFETNKQFFTTTMETITPSWNEYPPLEPFPYQRIFYGAPGTGKSHAVQETIPWVSGDCIFRTTFHPDSDYASFVGCYKPTMVSLRRTVAVGKKIELAEGAENLLTEEHIIYRFVPQVFSRAYAKAWQEWGKATKPSEAQSGDSRERPSPVFLVIEEINRGNCAQIFGDLFQLLDRNGKGFSEYAIQPDEDLGRWVAEQLKDLDSMESRIGNGQILTLPPNFFVWATMNTSDQSLFPIDSAFKRRWEWQYVPIRDAGKGWKIRVEVPGGEEAEYDWWAFLDKINGLILSATQSEDKQLGYFFAKPDRDGNAIGAGKFVNKVLFYLYNDAFKDYDLPQEFVKPGGGKFAFKDFFLADGKPDGGAVKELLDRLLEKGK